MLLVVSELPVLVRRPRRVLSVLPAGAASVQRRLVPVRLKIVSQDIGAAAELAALSRALDRIEAMPGSAAKTAAIREAAEELPRLSARAAEIRRAEVLRIRDEEQLTLAPLAERVGMSKARAGQIVKEARDA